MTAGVTKSMPEVPHRWGQSLATLQEHRPMQLLGRLLPELRLPAPRPPALGMAERIVRCPLVS